MAGAKIALSSTTGELQQDLNGNAKVNLPSGASWQDAGFVTLMGERHGLDAGGSSVERIVQPIKVSHDGRLRAGVDTNLWSDTFNSTNINLSTYQCNVTTATLVQTGGVLSFNNGNSTASGAVARVNTYRTFECLGESSLTVGFRARLTQALQTNNIIELGLGFAAGVSVPTDGIFFRFNGSGGLLGVGNFNGSETTVDLTSNGFSFTANRVYYFKIVIDQDKIEFYVDEFCYGVITIPNTAPAGSFSRQLPILTRMYNSAVTSLAQRLELFDLFVSSRDLALGKLWPTIQAGKGLSAVNTSPGSTAGQMASYANSTGPTSATLSNTAVGYAALGGQFQFAAVAGAETDYALFGIQAPVALVGANNKNLVIRGVRIETFNMGAAVATTPHLLQWALGVGSTGASLATSDSATAGTRSTRRIALGVQSLPVGAAIGAAASPIDVNLDAPLYVEAGTFAHVILKMPVATATASQIIRGIILVNAYWE